MTGEVRIERVIEAPRAEVFRAWTDPDELRRWWGPGEYATQYAEIDLRPGGDYLLVIQGAEGDAMHLAGTFHEVSPPERLVYSWRWVRGWSDPAESIVTVEFEDLGERTRVVLVHGRLDDSPDRNGYRMGWETGLAKLAAIVERSRTVPEADHSVTVAHPIEEVFAFLADAENDPRWRSGVLDIARLEGDGVGARYRQGVKGPMGRRVAADFEITEYAPPRALAFRAIAGPVRPEGRYELEPSGEGTRVRFVLECTPHGFARLMTPMVAKTMRSEVQAIERLPEAMGT